MLTSNNSLSGDSINSTGWTEMKNRSFELEQEKASNEEYMCLTESGKDERYWERRRKNNAAAKRSRERRRQHDMDLEQQIQRLKLLNSLLQKELFSLKQKLAYKDSLVSVHQSPSCTQSNEDNSFFSVTSLPNLIPSMVSTVLPNEKLFSESSDDCVFPPAEVINALYTSSFTTTNCHINPIDLSCKLKEYQSVPEVTVSLRPKEIQRSLSQDHMDQKYWDRRRRNNEAVRKCRQNKRAKILSSLKVGKENNDHIQNKIESISIELEKLKSQIKNPDHISMCSSGSVEAKSVQEDVSRFSEKKIWKWKTKLIEADQADKEMC